MQGIIKSVNPSSIRALYIELSPEHTGYADVFTGICKADNIEILNNLNKKTNKFKVG